MSDKDKLSFNEGDEEEFHITDEDIDRELAAMETEHPSASSGEAASETSVEKSSLKKRFAAFKQLKRKHWIIIAVIIIILFFGLIKMMGSRSSQTSFDLVPPQASKVDEVAKKVKADLTQKTLESNPLPDLTLSPTPPSSTVPAVTSHDTLKTDLSTIASNETKLTEALASISQQNQALTQKLSELSSRVGGLESVMNTPSQATSSTPKVTPSSPLPQQTQAQNLPEVPQYTVEAVVPQRAWIQAGDGSTITVTIGEALPGLGAVVSIDPYSGNVTTASGTVIKYGS